MSGATIGIGWASIVRLGLVQAAIGAVVVFATMTLNRVMVVELHVPAVIPAALVAWHYLVQIARARFGHGSDLSGRRTPWIVGGMALLAASGVLAALATAWMAQARGPAILLGIVAFAGLGTGVSASGTALLALLAQAVAPARRSAAAALTWVLMLVGFIVAAALTARLLVPFTPERLVAVAAIIASGAFVVTVLAVRGIEARAAPRARAGSTSQFASVLAEIWNDPAARRFTVFVFVSMLAFSAQELILEPFAGFVFAYSPAQSAALNATQHSGTLLGMIVVGIAGSRLGAQAGGWMRSWTIGGCAASAAAMALLALAARTGPGWPIGATVFGLGVANGVFAVAAIGSMMGLAGQSGSQGSRMGVWGAAQAIAFAAGGFFGAAGVDLGRHVFADNASAFVVVFAVEGLVFLVAAAVAALPERIVFIPSLQEFRP